MNIIIEGNIKRQSLIASGFVNERHFVLEGTSSDPDSFRLCSYRSSGDEFPSKTWKITRNTTVSAVSRTSCKLRGEEQVSPLGFLTALVVKQDSFQNIQLHAVDIIFSEDFSLPWSNEKLTLCFDDEATAEKWRLALTEAIISCQMHSKTLDKDRRAALASESSDAAAVMAALPSDHFLGPTSDLPGRKTSSSDTSRNTLHNYNASSSNNNTTTNDSESKRSWQSIYHINGVAVYAEDEGAHGEGGAVMASVVVRAPPRECFQVLMHTSPENSGSAGEIPFSDSVALLETIDAHTQVVRHSWLPERGLGRWIAAPRDFVGLRTWRKEPDGTYIVLYQSTTHRKARVMKNGLLNPWSPVRAKVEAAGFTISPLLPQYVSGGGTSQECLITLVIKADLAGSLSPVGLLSKLAPAVAEAARWRVMSPLLLSVVALRDRVEQRRFVVMPYTMSSEGDDVIMPSGAADENIFAFGGGGNSNEPNSPRMKLYQRTTTSLTEEAYNTAALSASKRAAAAAAGSLPPVMEDGSSDGGTMTTPGGHSPSAATATVIPDGNEGATTGSDDAWAVGGTTPSRFWSYPGSCNLQIRGPTYLVDRVKIPALAPMFDLYASDLVDGDEPFWDISKTLPSVQHCSAPFAFVLNLIYPANGMLQNLVSIWTAPVDVLALDEEALIAAWGDDADGTVRSFFHNFKPWMEGDGPEADARRNMKFKLIPKVAQGSWVVRQSVGTTPVLLGQKLKTRYFRGKGARGCSYFECDVDITSNTVANSVTRLVVNSITSLVVDLAPLVEGQVDEELPERLIGSIRYDHLDLRTSSVWDEDKSSVVARPT